MQKGYLILENGQAFPGVHCGAEADTVGELVFTTGMTGYLETLTCLLYTSDAADD